MSVRAVARQYANALADVVFAGDQVEQVERELGALAEALRKDREFLDFLASPVVTQEDKARILKSVIDRLKPTPTTTNLLNALLKNYRLQLLPEVYEEFRRVVNERRGIVAASVTTAAAIPAEQQTALTNKLERVTGKQVEFVFQTDPSLIGGVVTRVGSVVYDGSIKKQLEQIKRHIKQN